MIDHAELRDLVRSVGFPRVSIYMPSHRTGREIRQDITRLKNHVREVERGLGAQGLRQDQIASLLGDVQEKLEDIEFWNHQDNGLAVFVEPGRTRYLHLPCALDDESHVDIRYHVKPLIPLLMRDARFYVLAADHNQVTLYTANRYGMREIRDERIPESARPLVDVNRRAAPTVGALGATDENAPELQQVEIVDFAAHVANGVDGVLSGQQAPLVLAADDKLLGHLRQHLKYPQLVEEGIREHPRSLGPEALHEKAYQLVRGTLDQDRLEAIERFHARRGDPNDGRASDRLEDIVPAAVFGRVDTLILAPGESALGRFDADGMTVRRESEPGQGEVMDLVDFAVAETLANGGAVYTLPAGTEEPRLAALFRF
jgi:protein required for attachment to host cells